MAKRRRKRSTPRTMAPRKARRTTRRKLSGGRSPVKMLNNPIAGVIAGGVAALLVRKMVNKIVPASMQGSSDNIMMIAPLAAGYLLQKKMPFVAAGLIASPVVSFLQSKVTFLNDDNSLFADQPLLLSAYGEPLLLSEQGYSLNDGYNDDPDAEEFN